MSYYTFLPYAEQRNIRREYRVRALIVLFFFISLSFAIGIGALFPSYIYASFEERSHLDRVAAFKKTVDASTIAEIQKELSQSEATLNIVSDVLNTSSFYSTITSLVSLKGNVALTSLNVERSATAMVATISGIAQTRADLLAFKDRLQGLSYDTMVDLPISTLAQDTHVSFTIQVTEPFK